MKSTFDQLSVKCSRLTTNVYSTSFSLGIYFLHDKIRSPVYSIYGFVRFADEIVDSFDGHDKVYLLEKFRKDTYEAIESKVSLNPILNSFQMVVHRYQIGYDLIDTFLKSMEIDLSMKSYSREEYDEYILGSAEVVGLMCLHVFADGRMDLYNELKPFAMKLGAAFQKVNFLRDIKADYHQLGRTYFPGLNMSGFTVAIKRRIEDEIENDFMEALVGIRKLPATSRGGVYLAYVYYRSLFKKIQNIPAQKVMTERIRISNGEKFGLMCKSMLQFKTNLL